MTAALPESEVPLERKRSFLQISLRTFLLLSAIVAVWVTHLSNVRENSILQKRIEASRPLLRELVIKDEQKIAVIKQEEYWYDENQWDVYLPAGNYDLCLQTRQVGETRLPATAQRFQLAPGTHRIALDQQSDQGTWRTVVSVDGEKAIEVEEPMEWYASTGSTGGGHFSSGGESEADEAVILFRRRFNKATGANQFEVPAGPTDGVVLWIEPAAKK